MTTIIETPAPPEAPARITPEPGEYVNLPESDYHGVWRACSNSLLTQMRRSAAHCRWAMEQRFEVTEAFEVGSATDVLITQPELADSMILIGPTKGRQTKACIEFATANPGKIIVSEDGLETARRCADAVRGHPSARFLLDRADARQLAIAWDDQQTGVRCKGRIDLRCDRARTLCDLKTSRDASPEAFARSLYEYGYFRQAAMYLWGEAALGHDFDHFVFIVAEKEPPFLIACYRIVEDALEAGRAELTVLMDRFKHCTETNYWPGYGDRVMDVTLPHWAWDKLIERI